MPENIHSTNLYIQMSTFPPAHAHLSKTYTPNQECSPRCLKKAPHSFSLAARKCQHYYSYYIWGDNYRWKEGSWQAILPISWSSSCYSDQQAGSNTVWTHHTKACLTSLAGQHRVVPDSSTCTPHKNQQLLMAKTLHLLLAGCG